MSALLRLSLVARNVLKIHMFAALGKGVKIIGTGIFVILWG